uniref:Uncharacterized protein n=1 Tax=Ditylenchus dipsaci TaxID=166011 RepID=A0A915DK90_9BILA
MGEIDDNNPALFVSLPRQLNNNIQLRALLEKNSHELVSHHDLYATLLAIAKSSHQWNDQNWDIFWPSLQQKPELPSFYGSSILHTLKQPRSCPALRIPFEYCQCLKVMTDIKPSKSALNLQANELPAKLIDYILQASVAHMNADIAEHDLLSKCALLRPDPEKKSLLQQFEVRTNMSVDTFRITFDTQPGDGKFSAVLQIQLAVEKSIKKQLEMAKKTLFFISDPFPRLNSHKYQSKCAESAAKVQPYCYCNKTSWFFS